jgi:hypothetical protein
MKRILVAVAPAALPAIRGALADEVVVLPAHTLDDACQVLVARVDMIIAGVHFDDSHMFDLLRIAKADPTYRDIPFLCIRGVSGPIALGGNRTGPVLSNFEIVGTASTALGAAGFFDLYSLQEKKGVEKAGREFARIVRAYLDEMEAQPD